MTNGIKNITRLAILFSFTFMACQGCNQDKEYKKKLAANEKEAVVEEKLEFDKRVPDACTLITIPEIASSIGVEESIITIKDGSNLANTKVRSCFFRWEHEGIPNSGLLVQAQINPVPEEFPDWGTTFIKSKIEGGEKSFGGPDSETFTYKKFEGPWIEGAYNYEMSKYFWRNNDEMIHMIAFNLPGDEATQLEWAKKIANYVSN